MEGIEYEVILFACATYAIGGLYTLYATRSKRQIHFPTPCVAH